MTKEKRIEALTWLVNQADAIHEAHKGIVFDNHMVCTVETRLEMHLWGEGFYDLAIAASQPISTVHIDDTTDQIQFFFNGVRFFCLVNRPEKDGEADE